ncbi:MAG: chloride channel protein [Melioribacteraceae bacterium]|nr:chloride channel protein [Melioribacteraceae bacterium]
MKPKFSIKLRKRIIKVREFVSNRISRLSMPEYTVFAVYAIITGAAVGLAAVFFHKAIDFFTYVFFEIAAGELEVILGAAAVILIPVIGMLLQSLMTKISPVTAKKKGVAEVIKAVAMRGGFIRFRTTIFHFLAPAINIGSGGTVGPEGPAAQIGGGVASKLGQIIGLSDSRRRMFTAAGSGAAIAAVFNTPLGGIFFALEVVLLNDFQSATFSALILASVTASAISRIFLGDNPAFTFTATSFESYDQLYLYLILGIGAGIISLLFLRYSQVVNDLFAQKKIAEIPRWIKMAAVGLIVGVSGYFYNEIFGIGYHAINEILANHFSWNIVLILLVLKFILVPLILNSGGFGGVFAPSLFIGASFGYVAAYALKFFWDVEVDTTTFVLVGMGAVLGGINSIPISAILIIFEMTREYSFILPLMLSVVISTTIVQLVVRRSVHLEHLQKEGYDLAAGRESRILKSVQVKDIMRKEIVLLPEDTPLPVIVTKLLESHHSTFYTSDAKGNLTGAISENELRPIITEYEQVRDFIVAKDIARHELTTVKETDDLHFVLNLFGQRNIDEFPVYSEEGKIVGSITRQDVISAYNRESLKYNLADGLAHDLKNIEKIEAAKVAEGYSIIERRVPAKFVGKSVIDLQLRRNYGLEVLMIKQQTSFFEGSDDTKIIIPDKNYPLKPDDILVIFGSDEKLAQTEDWK